MKKNPDAAIRSKARAALRRELARAQRDGNSQGVVAAARAILYGVSEPPPAPPAPRSLAPLGIDLSRLTPDEEREIESIFDSMDAFMARVKARQGLLPPPEPDPPAPKMPDPALKIPEDARPAEDEPELPPIVIGPEPREDDDVYEWTEEEIETPDDPAE